MKSSSRARKLALVPLALAGSVPAFAFTAPLAGAADSPLITDFANYPSASVAGAPDGCDANSFINPMYTTSNGGTGPDLHALPPLRQGDTVTFTWSGIAPGCDAAQTNVTLAVKAAKATIFNPADTQRDVSHVSVPGTAGTVSIVMPPLADQGGSCAYQLDAVMGWALAVVGPTGSYYTAASRVDNQRSMLASSQLGMYPTCEQAPATPPPSPLPAPSAPTTTSPVLPVVLPTTSPSTATAPATAAQPSGAAQPNGATGGIATQVAGERVSAAPAQGQVAAGAATIPTTGANTKSTFMLGLGAIFSGAALLALPGVRRARARTQPTS